MLRAMISYNEQTAILELPMDRLSLQYAYFAEKGAKLAGYVSVAFSAILKISVQKKRMH